LRRRDYDAAVALFSDRGVLDLSQLGMGLFEGRAALRSFYEDWVGPYEDFEFRIEEFRELGNGAILTVLLHRGRLAASSGLVELRHAYAVTWVDGLVERSTAYADIKEGRAAAERLAKERQ
jgi:hypothetical protein